jgi:hypothetical protein
MLIRYLALGSPIYNRCAVQDYRFEGGFVSPVDFVRQEAT